MGSVAGDMGICPENGLSWSDAGSTGALEDTTGIAVACDVRSAPWSGCGSGGNKDSRRSTTESRITTSSP